MRLSRIALVLCAAAGAAFAAAGVPDFVPPGTKVVIGLSLRRLIDSPLLAAYSAEAKTMASGFTAGTALAGIDLFKDIDELILASTGDGDKAPTLAVIYGRFSVERFGAGAKAYHGVPLLEDAKNANSTAALLDESTLIAGETAQVKAAIDRRGKGSPIDAALAARVQALQSRYDIWGVGELPEGFKPSPSGVAAAAPPELQAIDRFEFGAALQKGLDLGLQIHVRSAKDAEKMMQTIQLLQMMMKMQPAAATGGSKFDLQTDHETLKLSIFIPEEELKKGIESQKAAWMAPAKKAEPPTPGSVSKNDRGDAVTVTLPRK